MLSPVRFSYLGLYGECL